ncbi:MAG: type II secretion system secretin GspD [Candidatus Schekmanbacteria bacterium]|nr:type II secretion system secretin GspD [Candidatus Schekmanbacteria bacterium]
MNRRRRPVARSLNGRWAAVLGGLYLLLLAMMFGATAPAAAEEGALTRTESGGVQLDFQQADIRGFIEAVAKIIDKTVIVDPRVAGKVTVTTPTEIDVAAVADVFELVLRSHGYAAVPEGDTLSIIPLVDAKSESVTTVLDEGSLRGLSGQRIATQVYRFTNIAAKDVETLFATLLTKSGAVATHLASNTLILTDDVTNLRRLSDIAAALDSAEHRGRVEVIPLQHAEAAALASEVNVLYGGSSPGIPGKQPSVVGQAVSQLTVVADARTNSLVVAGAEGMIHEVSELVKRLDIPPLLRTSNLRVYTLRYAIAEDLASVLFDHFSGNAPAPGGASATASAPTSSAAAATHGPDGGGAPARAPRRSSPDASIIVTADKTTNSLLVTASPADHAMVELLLERLDVVPLQAYVEALILEASFETTQKFGVEWRFSEFAEGENRIIGGTNLPLGTSADGPLNQAAKGLFMQESGLALGLVRGTITYGGQTFLNIAALVHALKGEIGVNILSTPHLLATNNQEAEIVVGEERPYLRDSQITDVGTVVRTFEYRDIGITLRLTPQISPDGRVRLKIHEEVKNFVEQSDLGAVTATKRKASTTAIAADGQTIVLGGLVRDEGTNQVSGVPAVSDIPVLGWLFKAKRRKMQKTNLLIFITPHVIRSPQELGALTNSRQEEIPRVPPFEGVVPEVGAAQAERDEGARDAAPQEESATDAGAQDEGARHEAQQDAGATPPSPEEPAGDAAR